MDKRFSNEQIERSKECKTVGELLALAKENGIELTEAEAQNYFAFMHPENGSLSDSELEMVTGGCEAYSCEYCRRGLSAEDIKMIPDLINGVEILYCKHCNRCLN